MISAVVRNYIEFSGDQEAGLVYNSGALANSPCLQQLTDLPVGETEVLVPAFSDLIVHGVAIVPPSGNVTSPVIKGAAGDLGIAINASRATVIQFGEVVPGSLTFEVDVEILGLRLVWF